MPIEPNYSLKTFMRKKILPRLFFVELLNDILIGFKFIKYKLYNA